MSQSTPIPPKPPSNSARQSSVDRSLPSSSLVGKTSLSPQPPNRSPSPFQITQTSDSILSSTVKAGTTAKDLYDASPDDTFRPVTSEFTFRIESSRPNGEADDTTDSDDQDLLTDQLKALELVKEAKGKDQPTKQVGEEALSDGTRSLVPHSSIISTTPFQYSADSESRPAEPFYSVDFQSSLKKAQKLANMFRDCLGGCEGALQQGSSLYKLREEAIRLSQFKCPSKRTIGVVGNSGQGKSSLINALLDTEGLALTDASGKAVTAFPTEYRFREEHQHANFVIKAECLNESEIDENLQELLDEFRKPYLSSANELTPAEFQAAEDKSHAAKQVFEAAFGTTKTSCENSKDSRFDPEMMKDESEGAYDRVLRQLRQWGRTLQWPKEMEDGHWEACATTVDEVCELVKPFTDRGLWVFVKITRIYLESAVLKSGIVLADLPGYHDVNFARVRAAKKYQAMCDEIFVVSDIKRAIDDPIIQEVVIDYCKRRTDVGQLTHPRITAVCTHSGDMGDTKNLEKHVPKHQLHHAKAQQDKVLKRQNMSGAEWKKAFNEAEINYKNLLLTARNNQIEKDLKSKYAADFDPGYLPVFCIDNRIYHTCQNMQEAILSGIPELRKFCYSIPAKAQFRSANHYISTEIPSLISSVELWIQAAGNPEMQSLSKIVPVDSLSSELVQAEERWQDILQDAFNGVVREYSKPVPINGGLLHVLKCLDEKSQEITKCAIGTCISWNRMHHASYAAWFRNNGTWSTKTVGPKCWNTELIENANVVLGPQWTSLDEKIATGIQWYLTMATNSMNKTAENATNAGAPRAFINNMRARQRQLRYLLEDEFYQFQRELGATKMDATSGTASSYIVALMRPVYNEGAMDSGSGVTERRRSLILSHVSGSGLFPELSRTINSNVNEAAQKHFTTIAAIVDEVLGAIEADLSTMTAPDTTVLNKYPEFGETVTTMLIRAEESLELLQVEAEGTTEWAKRLGYI